jgi:hypothetical protein
LTIRFLLTDKFHCRFMCGVSGTYFLQSTKHVTTNKPHSGYTIVAVALFVAIVVLCGMTFARAMTYGRAEICPACYLPYEFGAWCKLPNGHYAKNSQCNENDKVGLVEDYTRTIQRVWASCQVLSARETGLTTQQSWSVSAQAIRSELTGYRVFLKQHRCEKPNGRQAWGGY